MIQDRTLQEEWLYMENIMHEVGNAVFIHRETKNTNQLV